MMASLGCFDEVVKEAKVLARPLKIPLLEFGGGKSGAGRCREEVGATPDESEP